MSNIKAILFDYGGVLAEEGFRNGLKSLASDQGLDANQMPQQGMQAVYDSGFVLGRGTAADFWALLRQRTGLQGKDETLTQRILEGFVIRPWMLKIVSELKARGYVTGILSDQTDWLDLLNRRDEFFPQFDRIFNSFYLGKGKREPTLFTDVAATLELSPSEILFVDDDAGNIKRAHDCGYMTLQFVSQHQFLSELEKVLS